MDIFTISDLREHTAELVKDAEMGELSVVTKHGRPVFIAVPFDENVLKSGVSVSLAVKFYEKGVLNLGKAARFAGCSVLEFTEHLARAGVPSFCYSVRELDEKVTAIG